MSALAVSFPLGVLGLSRAEFRRALPVATSYAALLAAIYVLKPARNTLFLDVVGVSRLPWVLLAVAVLGAALAWLLTRAALSVVTLLPRLLIFGAVSLVGFRWLLGEATPRVAFAFYLFVNLFGQLTSAFIWLWATSSFDSREARRVFGFIAGAGIFGAFIGGAATGLLAAPIGTLGLLWIGAGLSLFAAVVVFRARVDDVVVSTRRELARAEPWSSPLVRLLSLGACVGAATSALVDLEFNVGVDAAFSDSDAKTAFFGAFFAVLNLLAFCFQLLVSPRLLRRFGVGVSVLMLPSALSLAALVLLFKPGIASSALLKTADVGLRHSLGRSLTEVLFAPLAPAVRLRARMLLDATFDNLGTGLGAGLGLAIAARFGGDQRVLGIAVLATVGVSAWVSVRLRPAYVAALKEGLLRREISPEELHPAALDATHYEVLLQSLSSDNPRRVSYALEVLRGKRHPDLRDVVRPLLSHSEALIRAKAVALLAEQNPDVVLDASEKLLADPDSLVRGRVLTLLAAREGERSELLQRALEDPDSERWEAALACVAEAPVAADVDFLGAREVQRFAEGGPRVVVRLIDAVGSCLEQFGEPDHSDWLVAQLGDARFRGAALGALERAGASALPALERALRSKLRPLARGAARVLGRARDGSSLRVLLTAARRTAPAQRGALVDACVERRRRQPRPLGGPGSRELVDSEAAWLGELTKASRALVGLGPKFELLHRALEEKLSESRRRLVRCLTLGHSLEFGFVDVALHSSNAALRARGLELLDEGLDSVARARLLPLLDPQVSRDGREPGASNGTAIPWGWLAEQPDPWLEQCARFVFSATQPANVAAPPGWRDATGIASVPCVLSLVEKVLLLQNVDVFAEANSEQLSLVAAIAEEERHPAGGVLYREGDPADAMFVIVRGRVRLHRGASEVSVLGADDALGTWALLEDEPRLTGATALEETVLLRIGRAAFLDVLADHVELTRVILARVARRLRAVLGQTGSA